MTDRKTLDQMTSDDLDELHAELDQLRAGEEDGYDPLTEATPGQWIHQFNQATPEKRLEVVAALLRDSARGRDCWFLGHEKRLADDRHAWVAVARVRDVIADMENITGARHWARILRKAVDGEEPAPGPDTAATQATEADAPDGPVCGAEPPAVITDAKGSEWLRGDCWCTLPPDHDGAHHCQPCTERHGAPGWQDEPDDTDQAEAEPHTGLTVQTYRRADDGLQRWVFRCWGTDTCDGWLSLDHDTERWAEIARDRHVAEEHAEPVSGPAATQATDDQEQPRV